jgi:redox-sensing transcriptional repressor
LLSFFSKTLDQDELTKVALIGVGNLGTAFLNYNFLKNNNTRIECAFDVDPNKMGTTIGDVPVYPMDELEKYLGEDEIPVAILTVPASVAQPITDKLIQANVKGILNFTPARLNVPPSIRVHHIDLSVELQSLIYFLKHYPTGEIIEEDNEE